jgi:hypothetical protein
VLASAWDGLVWTVLHVGATICAAEGNWDVDGRLELGCLEWVTPSRLARWCTLDMFTAAVAGKAKPVTISRSHVVFEPSKTTAYTPRRADVAPGIASLRW